MTAYRFWTLTCDGCGEVWDYGIAPKVRDAKASARRNGWETGRTRQDTDRCDICVTLDKPVTP